MNKEMLKEFEGLFIELKKNAINELKLNAPVNSERAGDDVDLSNTEREEALDLRLKSRQSIMLKKIDQALGKIKNGTYGTCEECGCDIEINRLRARPTTDQCITCKEEQERGEGKILYQKRSHTLGKSLNNSNVLIFPERMENEKVININDHVDAF